MTQTENKVIQCRRDTAANWASNNPVPKAGEWCFETDTGITKIGDGSTAYNSLVPFRQTTATTTELNKLHSLSTTNTELGYVHGVTSSIQPQINSKLAKADIQTSFGETLSDEKVASEKLVKNTFDTKQDIITTSDNKMLLASVLSSMNIIGENNEGRAYTEPKTYDKMLSAAHSTFDLSKFTVVGSPTITSDGILTLADNSNCIYKQINYFGDANNFDIIYPLYLTGNNTSDVWDYRDLLNLRSGNSNVLRLYSQSRNSITSIVCRMVGNNDTIYGLQITPALDLNQQYLIKISKKGNTYGVYYKTPQTGWTLFEPNRLITSSDTLLDFDSLRFTQCSSYERIDLKQFSITVDGVEVFSGNKTGLDVIKPDNYSVVGTPTISADGIASGFGNNASIRVPNVITDKPFIIKGVVHLGNVEQENIIGCPLQDWAKFIGANYDNANANLGKDENENIINLNINNGFVKNKSYVYELSWDGITYNFSTTRLDTNETKYATPVVAGASQLLKNAPALSLGVNYSHPDSVPLKGSIDLNAIHFYDVNGNLVYQPCLKIPYTLAANDKKFISPIYEGRAKDMADQFGVAPYHILDEENQSFILPYGSVDSKVAPKILVDSGEGWEQFLDRTMIQRGTMTADTPVTFPCEDEFADTDYSLSCPYSAKTKTGFTPTVSGEYIAVGKV